MLPLRHSHVCVVVDWHEGLRAAKTLPFLCLFLTQPIKLIRQGLLTKLEGGEASRGHRTVTAVQLAPFKVEAVANSAGGANADALRASLRLRLLRSAEQRRVAAMLQQLDLALTAGLTVGMHVSGASAYRKGFATGMFGLEAFDYEKWRKARGQQWGC